MKIFIPIFLLLLSCPGLSQDVKPAIMVLGVCQDGGYPHMGCRKECCKAAWNDDSSKQYIVSLALVDWIKKEWWLFEASPDIAKQIQFFHDRTNGQLPYMPQGIFITHAHIGHYSGLVQLGREVLNTARLPVYVMPKMKAFLEKNGPWSQLVQLGNVLLWPLQADQYWVLTPALTVTPFLVPHRDEFSETVGFKIEIIDKNYLFIPDIDKWEKWDRSIVEEVKKSDGAFIDATFFSENELTNRSIQEIPHPLVSETMKLFEHEYASDKEKIKFIHFNHTNPLLWSMDFKNKIKTLGFSIAVQGQWY